MTSSFNKFSIALERPQTKVLLLQMMQPEAVSQLSARNSNSVASALGLPAVFGTKHPDQSHGPAGSAMSSGDTCVS